MIRFVCAHCAKPLRAPPGMAGKKGRCAQCNGVNLVPVVTSVDVKRVTAPTPFRNADAPVRGAIERVVEMSGVRFAATPPESGHLLEGNGGDDDDDDDHDRHPRDFFDQIAPRMGTVAEGFDVDVQPRAAAAEAAIQAEREHAARLRMHAVDSAAYELEREALAAAHLRRAVVAALIAGAILGFVAGLLASKWIL